MGGGGLAKDRLRSARNANWESAAGGAVADAVTASGALAADRASWRSRGRGEQQRASARGKAGCRWREGYTLPASPAAPFIPAGNGAAGNYGEGIVRAARQAGDGVGTGGASLCPDYAIVWPEPCPVNPMFSGVGSRRPGEVHRAGAGAGDSVKPPGARPRPVQARASGGGVYKVVWPDG